MARRRDGLGIAAIAFIVYFACRRDAWHGIDMLALSNAYHVGELSHGYYTFYPGLIRCFTALAEAVGSSMYQATLLLSSLGTACGVACTHEAGRLLGMRRADAAFAAVAVAATPAVAYFAVVMEVHGHVLACVGLAWVVMARWAVAPRPGGAVLVACALAFAWLAHPMAGLAGMAMLPIAGLASPVPRPRQLLAGCVGAAACLVAFVAVWLWAPAWWSGRAASARGDDAWTKLLQFAAIADEAENVTWATKLWQEWWLPFLPMNACLVLACCVGPARRTALEVLAATAPFVLVSLWILVDDERGAYVTMAVGPMALVLAACLRSTTARVLYVAMSIGVALWLASRLQCDPRTIATARAVRAAVGERQLAWLVGDGAGPDGQAWLTTLPRSDVVILAGLLTESPERCAKVLADLEERIARAKREGVPTIVTSTTIATLSTFAPAHPPSRVVYDWLMERRGAALAEVDGVTVYAVTPR